MPSISVKEFLCWKKIQLSKGGDHQSLVLLLDSVAGISNMGSFFGGMNCYQSYGVVSSEQGYQRDRLRAEEWCSASWNTCNFSADGISAGNSGTGSNVATKGSGKRTNGLDIFREDGHIRLGIAKHDGFFYLSNILICMQEHPFEYQIKKIQYPCKELFFFVYSLL